ncbi:MAG: hypothetical protein GC193_08490 [Cryomorphaceae bacterium]|nr:hypothetical protein [Cryomorphaceae bacterium]
MIHIHHRRNQPTAATTNQLEAAHRKIQSDFLPTMEHYLDIMSHYEGRSGAQAAICFYWFKRFKQELNSHFRFEEQYIFPFMEGIEPELTDEARNFVTAHDDLEERLTTFLNVLTVDMIALKNDMIYNLLVTRVEKLIGLLELHAHEEHSLFERILKS